MADAQPKADVNIKAKIAQHFLLASVGIFVIIFLLGYLLLIGPAIGKIDAANRMTRLNLELVAKKAYLANLDDLLTNYRKIPAEDVDKIQGMIPFEDDLPGLMVDIDAVAKKNDMNLASISFSGGLGTGPAGAAGTASPSEGAADVLAGPAGLIPISINMSVENADYARFKNFLQSIERHLRIFDILSMSINPSGAQYVISMRTYVHPPLVK